jgi:hypothetical protein
MTHLCPIGLQADLDFTPGASPSTAIRPYRFTAGMALGPPLRKQRRLVPGCTESSSGCALRGRAERPSFPSRPLHRFPRRSRFGSRRWRLNAKPALYPRLASRGLPGETRPELTFCGSLTLHSRTAQGLLTLARYAHTLPSSSLQSCQADAHLRFSRKTMA